MSSLIGKIESDVELKAPAQKFHDMLCNRPYDTSNASPDKVQACDLHDGNWGKEGSILYWNYVHEGKHKVAKEVIEGIDRNNYSISFRVIGGDLLKEYKSFVIKLLQVTPKNQLGEGSIARWTVEYEKLHGGIADPKSMLDYVVQCSKDIDAHLMLQAN